MKTNKHDEIMRNELVNEINYKLYTIKHIVESPTLYGITGSTKTPIKDVIAELQRLNELLSEENVFFKG